MGAGGGLREGARGCYFAFAVYFIGRIAGRRAPDSFWEGRWPEVLVGGYLEGRIWVMVFGEDLGLFDQRIFSPASVGSMAPTSSMARPNPF